MAVCLLPGSCSQGRRYALPRTPSHSPASGLHGERVPQAPRGNHRAVSPPVAKPARKLFQTKVRLQTASPHAPVAPLPTPAPSTSEKWTFQLWLDTRIDITAPLGDDGSDTTAHSCSVVASAATSTVHHYVATSLFADRTSAQTMRANQLRLYFASFAYALLELLRRWGLSGTRLARAQCGTIRLKLLKIGVRIRVSVRAVRLSFDEGFPEAGLFGQVLARLQSLPLRC